MKTVRKVKVKGVEGERVCVKMGREMHRQIKVIAALDGTSFDEAFHKYAAPAVAKAFEAKTAPTK